MATFYAYSSLINFYMCSNIRWDVQDPSILGLLICWCSGKLNGYQLLGEEKEYSMGKKMSKVAKKRGKHSCRTWMSECIMLGTTWGCNWTAQTELHGTAISPWEKESCMIKPKDLEIHTTSHSCPHNCHPRDPYNYNEDSFPTFEKVISCPELVKVVIYMEVKDN